MSDLQGRQAGKDMKSSSSHTEEERPSRRTKFESKLYNFLNRSRSRSRSKQEAAEESNSKSQKAVRRSSLKNPAVKPMSGTKPASRIPSRPLSSTTTATSSTVVPGTPKPKRRVPSTLPPPPAVKEEPKFGTAGSSSSRPAGSFSSRPATPKSSATKKLQNLFAIPLGLASRKSSRSRSRSRPNTPEPTADIPPLPTLGQLDDDTTPKPRKSNSPHRSRPHTPPTPSKSRLLDPSSNGSSAGSPANALKLPKLFSGRTTATLGSNHQQRPSNSAAAVTSSKSGIPVVSAPIRRPASANRRVVKPETPPDSVPAAISTKRPNGASVQSTSSAMPESVQPSNLPLKQRPLDGNSSSLPTKGKTMSHHVPKFSSMDSGYRYRGGNMAVVDEEGRQNAEVKAPIIKGKSKEAESSSHLRTGVKKMSSATRNTRHGSFDFERPGWGTSLMQRTGSTGTNDSTTTSHHSRMGDGAGQQERESTFGPGLAGVGTLQKEMSIRRLKDTEEGLKARDRARRLQDYIQNDKHPPLSNGHGSSSNHSDHMNASTSTNETSRTNGTAHTGKSSSLGKAAAKRSLAGGRAGGSGLGLTRLIRTAHHPLFSFEPPVPSPTWSTASNGTAVDASKADNRHRLKEVKRPGVEKKVASVKGDRPPVPVPAPLSSIPHRSGNRGRSLDLGLGLAWAPSTMKETALLPSSTLFARSLSSSTTGRSASGSVVARSASSSTTGNEANRVHKLHVQELNAEVERSKLGKEVAELFRNVLDDRGYNTFKNYVRRFDMHEIPFDGRNGIVERVERLLADAPGVSINDKQLILEKFVRIILQNA